ncbi:MAG: hypothetical protein OEX83_01800 [Gammaproteobacteria bacterium]|nr:hypothetical protein [Gammaproteobacteria bacterium]
MATEEHRPTSCDKTEPPKFPLSYSIENSPRTGIVLSLVDSMMKKAAPNSKHLQHQTCQRH